MNIEIKEDLKEGILIFIKGQQGYNVDEVEEITVTNKDEKNWIILYGESIDTGIFGSGTTPAQALDNFLTQWKSFNGFEWIKSRKMA